MSELTIATTIFLITYGVIVSERLDRTAVALAGLEDAELAAHPSVLPLW